MFDNFKTYGIVGVSTLTNGKLRVHYKDGYDDISPKHYIFYNGEYEGFDEVHRLRGDLPLNMLGVSNDFSVIYDAKQFFIENGIDFYLIPDVVQQHFSRTNNVMFYGMTFDDVKRMQIDIEVRTKFPFPSADRKEDEIFIIAINSNFGLKTVLSTLEMSEKEILIELIRNIMRHDPDILEGHNIFGFDLPYILERCKMYNISFGIGRDGTVPSVRRRSRRVAERTYTFDEIKINGRSIIDTMFLAADYDIIKRELPSLSLKDVAKTLGVAPQNREYIEGSHISSVWESNPERVLAYALDDVIETEAVSRSLAPSLFYLSTILPMPLQNIHLSGNGAIIESMFVRHYLRRMHSLPLPEKEAMTVGGYTEVFRIGIYDDILYADVESLYPSIMLNYDVAPSCDKLGFFKTALGYLTDRRFELKHLSKTEENETLRKAYDGQQNAFKILINSFFGMLGFRFALFNDISEADRVTSTGQKIVKQLINVITSMGGNVIEADTDGVLFVRPDGVENEEEFVKGLSKYMPDGINVGFDGKFKRMLSYKKKNYVLLGYDGSKKIKGGAFKSRGAELFIRDFINEVIDALMNNEYEEVHEIYKRYHDDVVNRRIGIERLKRRAVLKKSISEYEDSVNNNENVNRQAAYEVAMMLDDMGIPIEKGHVVEYYVAGDELISKVRAYRDAKPASEYSNDENIRFYEKRLKVSAKRFKPIIENFDDVFSLTDETVVAKIKNMENYET